MYPIDRRKLAIHVYSLLNSLRKTAIILNVSHTTISRWIKNPEQKKYTSTKILKSSIVSQTIKASLDNDPFISIRSLSDLVFKTFNFKISKELVRTIIKKHGLSRKKARFFSKPTNLEVKIQEFIKKRQEYLDLKYPFYSLDETSFGRHGKSMMGYSPRGTQLRIKRSMNNIITVSYLVIASSTQIINKVSKQGSFNTIDFLKFLKSLFLPINSVILLDNISFHHSQVVKTLCLENKWNLLYTPPYSPQFNPIEGIFSIIKRTYYKTGLIENSFKEVQQKHCQSFFNASLNHKN